MASSESKVGPQATTLDALDPFDSDRGPHLMQLMHLKSGPKAKTSEPFDSCGAFEPFDAEATEARGEGGLKPMSLCPRSGH